MIGEREAASNVGKLSVIPGTFWSDIISIFKTKKITKIKEKLGEYLNWFSKYFLLCCHP